MANNYYLPDNDQPKNSWLENFRSKLATNAAALGVSSQTVTQTAADAKNFDAMLKYNEAVKTYTTMLTAYKNQLRDGTKNGQPIGTLPAPPALPTFTPPVLGDIFGRVALLVRTIKGNANLTDAMSKDLGIVGAEITAAALAAIKPTLAIEMQSGHPNIKWKKGEFDGIHIKVDRGTGKFDFLATDTVPDYLDTFTLPPFGKAEVWKYVAIYIKKDEEVGDWSDVLEVSVKGQP